MKKYAVIMIALLIMLIGGCSAGNKSLSDGSSENSVIYNSSAPEDDVKYTYVCAQYIYYNTADELMKACDIVMSGKVTGISFTVRMAEQMTRLPGIRLKATRKSVRFIRSRRNLHIKYSR